MLTSIAVTVIALTAAILPGNAPAPVQPHAAAVLSLGGAPLTSGVVYAGAVGRVG